jgi:hypothetical protein
MGTLFIVTVVVSLPEKAPHFFFSKKKTFLAAKERRKGGAG